MLHALQCHRRPVRQITQGEDVSRDSRWSHIRSAPAPVIFAHKAEQSEKREAPAKHNNAFTALGTRRTDRPQIMDLMGNPAVKANIFTELSRDGLFVLCAWLFRDGTRATASDDFIYPPTERPTVTLTASRVSSPTRRSPIFEFGYLCVPASPWGIQFKLFRRVRCQRVALQIQTQKNCIIHNKYIKSTCAFRVTRILQ